MNDSNAALIKAKQAFGLFFAEEKNRISSLESEVISILSANAGIKQCAEKLYDFTESFDGKFNNLLDENAKSLPDDLANAVYITRSSVVEGVTELKEELLESLDNQEAPDREALASLVGNSFQLSKNELDMAINGLGGETGR